MGSVRPVTPARDSPGDSLPDVSARGPCATRSARPAAPSWPCRSRITSKRSKSAPKLDHGQGRPHHRRARGFSTASRRTPHEPSPWPAAGPPAYAHGPWARAAPSPLLRRGQVPVGCACACTQPSLRSAIFYQRTSEVQFWGVWEQALRDRGEAVPMRESVSYGPPRVHFYIGDF